MEVSLQAPGSLVQGSVDLETLLKQLYQRRKSCALSSALSSFFQHRLKQFAQEAKQKPEIAVTITWNTDGSDVDLWVTEPGGEKCYYGNKITGLGGKLSQDITAGYGPERYTTAKATVGKYLIELHYFGFNVTRMSQHTTVNVNVSTRSTHGKESTKNYTIILKGKNDKITVAELEWPAAGE